MTKQELEKRYSKALQGGAKMLDAAALYEQWADENKDEKQASLQRAIAYMLRDYYGAMFD